MVQPLNGHDKPRLPETHYLDNRIFTEEGIFQEEREKIFAKVWQFACHESEVEKSGDFRCVRIASKSLLLFAVPTASFAAFTIFAVIAQQRWCGRIPATPTYSPASIITGPTV